MEQEKRLEEWREKFGVWGMQASHLCYSEGLRRGICLPVVGSAPLSKGDWLQFLVELGAIRRLARLACPWYHRRRSPMT